MRFLLKEDGDYYFKGEFNNIMRAFSLYLMVILLLIALVTPFVNASPVTNFTINNGDTYIRWNWEDSDNSVSEIVIDGGVKTVYNQTYFSESGSFILSNLKPNSIHSIKIKNEIDDNEYAYNETYTTKEVTSSEKISDFIYSYIWWIVSIILLAIAAIRGNAIIGYLSIIASVLGLLLNVNSDNTSFLIYMLYVVTIIAGYLVSDNGA